MIEKIYELICDNPDCGEAMNHLFGTKEEVKRKATKMGHIIKGNKCFCNQKCYDSRKTPAIRATKIFKKV